MRGQTYVQVEAAASEPMAMDPAGSQGEFKGDYTIMWKKNPDGSGGVTGTFGWPDGYWPGPDATVDEINGKISERWKAVGEDQRNVLFAQWFPVCARLK